MTACIYYLSSFKYQFKKLPANEFNKIFIDTKKKQQPNDPKHVKIKRFFRISSSSESSFSTEISSSSEDSFDSIDNIDTFDTDVDSSDESSTLSSLESSDNSNNGSNNDNTIENGDLILSNNILNINQIYNNFANHVPKWGGYFYYARKKYFITNTCTVDYLLLGIWTISQLKANFVLELPRISITEEVVKIIELIDKNDWNNAKKLLILDILKINPNEKHISLFGTENEFFINFFSKYQNHFIKQQCSPNCYLNNSIYLNDSSSLYFVKIDDIVTLTVLTNENCNLCSRKINATISLQHHTNFLIIESSELNIRVYDLPENLNINGNEYTFLCTPFNENAHFKSIFKLNKKFYLVDDLDQSIIFLTELDQKSIDKEQFNNKYGLISTSTSLYYLK